MVDLAGCADVVAEELRRHDEVGAVATDMAMQGFLNADCTVASLNVDFAQEKAARQIRITLDLSHAERGVAAVAELDHWKSRERERENIDLARLGGPGFTAACAIQIAVAHIDDCDVLAMTADVLITTIIQTLAYRGANELPLVALRFFRVAIFNTGRAACLMPARCSGFNAMILTPIRVAAAEPEEAIMAITFGVRPD